MTDKNIDGLEQLLDLEEKVTQTIELLKSTRSTNEELQRENSRLRQESRQHSETIQTLEDRLNRMEKERDTVRVRLQRLLDQVDSLTAERAPA
jgi:FtsZ-binding cell division protein ZapB